MFFLVSFLLLKVEDIKKISEYVAQLRRMGKGHGNSLLLPKGWFIFHMLSEIEVLLLDLQVCGTLIRCS